MSHRGVGEVYSDGVEDEEQGGDGRRTWREDGLITTGELWCSFPTMPQLLTFTQLAQFSH